MHAHSPFCHESSPTTSSNIMISNISNCKQQQATTAPADGGNIEQLHPFQEHEDGC
jgi:hypothetical protein